MAQLTKSNRELLNQSKEGDVIAKIEEPKTFDAFKLALDGVSPNKASQFMLQSDKIELHDPEYYLKQLQDAGALNENDPDYDEKLKGFSSVYAKAAENYGELSRALPYFDNRIVKPFVPFSSLEDPRPDPNLTVDENPGWFFGGFSGSEVNPSFSSRNWADIQPFHTQMDENGNETLVDSPVTLKDRKNLNYRYIVKYDQEGKYTKPGSAYYTRVPYDSELSGQEVASRWGYVDGWGGSPLIDGALGLISAIPRLGAGIAGVFEVGAGISNSLEDLIGISVDLGLSDYFRGAKNTANSFVYEPSEETARMGFTGGAGSGSWINGFSYAIGSGIGDLAIQMLPGLGPSTKIGSLLKMSPKAARNISASLAVIQASPDVREAAYDAGLRGLELELFTVVGMSAIGISERMLATPYLTRRFARNESKALQNEIYTALRNETRAGLDINKPEVQATALKKGLSRYYQKIEKAFGKIKSGETGLDEIPVLSGTIREGSQETLEELLYLGEEFAYDRTFGRKNDIGFGNFGSDTPKWRKEAKHRLKESAIGGSLLGGFADAVLPHGKYEKGRKLILKTLVDNGAEKGEKIMRDVFDAVYDDGRIGSQNHLFNGEVLTKEHHDRISKGIADLNSENISEEEKNNIKSSLPFTITLNEDVGKLKKGQTIFTEGDINYYNLNQELNSYAQSLESSGLKHLEVLDQINTINDPALKAAMIEKNKLHSAATIEMARSMTGMQQEINEIDGKLSAANSNLSEDEKNRLNQDRIKKVKDIEILRGAINERVQPEEGSEFPKFYNDFAKTHLAASNYAREKTEAEERGLVGPTTQEDQRKLHYLDQTEPIAEGEVIDEVEDEETSEDVPQIEKQEEKFTKKERVAKKLLGNLPKKLNPFSKNVNSLEERQQHLNTWVNHYNEWLEKYGYAARSSSAINEMMDLEINNLRDYAKSQQKATEHNAVILDQALNPLRTIDDIESTPVKEAVDLLAPFKEKTGTVESEGKLLNTEIKATKNESGIFYEPFTTATDSQVEAKIKEAEDQLTTINKQIEASKTSGTEESIDPSLANSVTELENTIADLRATKPEEVEANAPKLTADEFIESYVGKIDSLEDLEKEDIDSVELVSFSERIDGDPSELNTIINYKDGTSEERTFLVNENSGVKPVSNAQQRAASLRDAIKELEAIALPEYFPKETAEGKIDVRTADELNTVVAAQKEKIMEEFGEEDPELADALKLPIEELADNPSLLNKLSQNPLTRILNEIDETVGRLSTRSSEKIYGISVSELAREKEQSEIDAENDYLKNNDDFIKSVYLNATENLLKDYEADAENKFARHGSNPSTPRNLAALYRAIRSSREMARVSNEILERIMNNGSDKSLKRHLTKKDHPLKSDLYDDKIEGGKVVEKGIRSNLEDQTNRVKVLIKRFGDATRMEANFELNLQMGDIELKRLMFSHLSDVLGLQDVKEINDVLNPEIVPVLTEEEKSTSFLDTKEVRDRILKANEALFRASQYLYENRELFITAATKDSFIEKVFRPLMSNHSDIYLNGNDYGLKGLNYSSLIAELPNTIKDLYGPSNRIDLQAIFSVQLANYLSTTFSVNPELLLSANRTVMESIAEFPTGIPLAVSEQRDASDQVAAFIYNNGVGLLEDIVKAQIKWSEEDFDLSNKVLQDKKNANEKRLRLFRPTNMWITGDAATGKSSVVLRDAIHKATLLKKGKIRIGVHALTSNLRQSLLNTLKVFGENVELVPINREDAFKSHDVDLLIWDEAGLLTYNQFEKVNAMNDGKLVIYLGDATQMTNLKRLSNPLEFGYIGGRTKPLSTIHTTKLSLHQNLMWHFRNNMIIPNTNELPKMYEEVQKTPAGEKLKGGRYYRNKKDLVDAFFNRNSSNAALLFTTFEQAKSFILNDPRAFETDGKYYVLEGDYSIQEGGMVIKDSSTNKSVKIDSIQGLRESEVYIAFDRAEATAINTKLTSLYGRLFYTAITRLTDYVALIGNGENVSKKEGVDWYDPTEKTDDDKTKLNKETSRYQAMVEYYNKLEIASMNQKVTEEIKVKEEEKPKAEKVIERDSILRIGGEGKNPGRLMRVEYIGRTKVKKEINYIKGHLLNEDHTPLTTDDGKLIRVDEHVRNLTIIDKEIPSEPIITHVTKSGLSINAGDIFVFDEERVMIDEVSATSSGEEIIGHTSDGRVVEKIIKPTDVVRLDKDSYIDERFPLSEPSTASIAYGNKTRSRIEWMHENGKNVLWGTTYTVFSADRVLGSEDIKNIRLIKPYIHRASYGLRYQIEYHKNAEYLSDDGERSSGESLLVRFDQASIARIKAELEAFYRNEPNLPEDVKDALKMVIEGNYDDALPYVSALQLNNNDEGSISIVNNILMRARSSNEDVLLFKDEVTGSPQYFNKEQELPGKLIEGKEVTADSFIELLKQRGYSVSEDWIWKPSFQNTTGGAFIKTYSIGNASSFIVGRSKAMNELSSEDLRRELLLDYEMIKNAQTRGELNTKISTSYLINWLRFNGSLISKSPDIKGQFESYGLRVVDGRYYFGEEDSAPKEELQAIKAFIDNITNDWNSSKTSQIRKTFQPIFANTVGGSTRASNKNVSGRSFTNPEMYVKYKDVHAPSIFINVSPLLKNPTKSSTADINEDLTDKEKDLNKLNDILKKTKKNLVSNASLDTKMEDAASIIKRILGRDEAIEFFDFDPYNDNAESILLGQMANGLIRLRVSNGMVAYEAPRHEAFHKIYNYAISQTMKRSLVEEWRQLHPDQEWTYESAEEAMAKEYGLNGNKYIKEPKSLWDKFVRFLERIAVRLKMYNKDLYGLFADIESGIFADINFSTSDQLSRNLDLEQEDNQLIEDIGRVDILSSNTILKERFGNRKNISNVSDRLVSIYNGFSVFNTDDFIRTQTEYSNNEKVDTLDRVISVLKEYASTVGENIYNGKAVSEMKLSDVESLEKDLRKDVFEDYMMYQLADPEVFSAVFRKHFKDYDLTERRNRRHTKETFSEKETFDPKNYTSDLLKLQIRSTPLLRWDSNNAEFISTESNEVIGDNEIYPYLSKASVEARRLVQTGEMSDFIPALLRALKTEANILSVNSRKKDVIMSFIHRWLEDQTWDGPMRSEKSIGQHVKWILSTGGPQADNNPLVKLFNSFVTHFANYQQLSTVDYKVYFGSEGELRVKAENRISDPLVEGKRKIADRVRHAISDNFTHEPKDYALDQIRPGRKQRFEITNDGIYHIQGKDKTKIIHVSRDKSGINYSLVYKDGITTMDHFALQDIRYLLGLNNVGNNIFISLRDGANPELAKFMQEFTGLNFKERDFSQQVLASGLYNMMASLKLWGDMRSEVKKRVDAITAYTNNTEEIHEESVHATNEIINELKQNPIYDGMMDYMKKSGELSTLDPTMEMFNNEDEEYSTKELPFPTPLSFYNFFNLLAKIKTFYSVDPGNHFTTSFDGVKRYNHVTNSSYTRKFGNGSAWLPGYVARLVTSTGNFDNPGEINRESLDQATYMEEKDGKIVVYNSLVDPNDPMQLLERRSATSIVHFRSSSKPNVSDKITEMFTSFLEGVKKRSELIVVPTINLGDTQHMEFMVGTFDNSWKTRLFNMQPVVKDGHLQSDLSLNESLLNTQIEKLFKMNYRNQQVAAKKLFDWMKQEPILNGKLKNLHKNFKNPSLFSEDVQRIFNIFQGPAKQELIKSIKNSGLYSISEFLEKDGDLTVGRAIKMNDAIYNYSNYLDFMNSKDKTKARKKIMKNSLEEFISMVIEHQTYLPSEMRGMLSKDGNKVLYDDNDKGRDYNPVVEGFFYAQHIFSSFASPFVFGSWHGSKSEELRSRASRTAITPKTHLVPGTGMLGQSFRTLNINQTYLENPRGVPGASKIELMNGEGISNPVLMEFVYEAMGDEYGVFDRTALKPLIDYADPLSLQRIKYKQALENITSDTYDNNPYYREYFKAMLDHTSEMVRLEGIDIDLHQVFSELLNNGNFSQAIKGTVSFIRKHPMVKTIMENMVFQITNESVLKEGARFINDYNPGLTSGREMKSQQIPVSEVGFILNAYQDPERINDNASRPNQLFSYLSTAVNKKAFKRVDELSAEIYNLAEETFNKDLRDIDVPEGLDAIDSHIYRMSEFLRNKGLGILDKIEMGGNYANIILNKDISIDFPGIRELVIFSFRNYVNDTMVNRKMNGIRHTQLDGGGFLIFRDNDGNRYMWGKMEKMIGRRLSLSDLSLSKMTEEEVSSKGQEFTFIHDGKTYNVSRLQPMLPGKKGEIVIPFSQIKQFGLSRDGDINDLFTLVYNDGKTVNVRNMKLKEIERLVNDGLRKKLINKKRTLFINKAVEENYINYINAAKKILDNVYTSRVPLNRLGSGDVNEVVGFINDNGNVLYLPPEKPALDDSDFDIDAKTTYFFKVNNKFEVLDKGIDGKTNEILSEIVKVFSDVNESKTIFFPSSLDELKVLRDESLNEDLETAANTLGGFLKHSFMNDIGKESISVYAVAASTLGQLAKLGDDIKTVAPAFSSLVPLLKKKGRLNPVIMVGDLLQAALDNEKLNILGPLGFTRDAAPVVVSLISQGYTFKEIKEIFSDPTVSKIFRQIAKKHSVTQYLSDYVIQDIVQDEIDKLDASVAGINVLSPEQAKMKIDELLLNTFPEETPRDEMEANFDRIASKEDYLAYYDYKRMLEYPEKSKRLKTIMDALVLAESLYRLGRIVNLRNGVKVLEYEHKMMNNNLQLYFGMRKEEFIAGMAPDVNQRVKYWEDHSAYKNMTISVDNKVIDTKIKERALAFEHAVQDGMNMAEVVRALPNFQRYVTAQFINEDYLRYVFLPYTEFSDESSQRFNQMINQSDWRFAKQFDIFKEKLGRVFADYFFKKLGDNSIVYLPNVYEDIDIHGNLTGRFSKEDSAIEMLRLSETNDQLKFRKAFPRFFDLLINAVENTDISGDPIIDQDGRRLDNGEKMLLATGLDYKWIQDLRGNEFFNSLSLEGEPGAEYVQMKDGRRMDSNEIAFLQEEFARMDDQLKNLFQFNQIISRGFNYTKGSISDVVGTGLYPTISVALDEFKGFLRSKNISEFGVFQEELMNNFVNSLGTVPTLTPYLSEHKAVSSNNPTMYFHRKEKVVGYLTRNQSYYRPKLSNAEVPIFSKYGSLFAFNDKNITTIEPIYNFNYEDLNIIEFAANNLSSDIEALREQGQSTSVVKFFPRGHGYKNNALYYTTGHYLRAKTSNTMVRFFLENPSAEELKTHNLHTINESTDKARKLRAQLEEDLRKKEEEVRKLNESLSKNEEALGIDFPRSDQDLDSFFEEQAKEMKGPFKRMETKRLSQKSSKVLFDHLAKSYGVYFIADTERLNNDQTRALAWFENDGVHYDESRIHYGMPLHELNHIWVEVISKSNPDLYNQIMDKVRRMRGTKIYERVAKKYAGQIQDQIDKEFLATMTGFYSVDLLEGWLMKNGVEVETNLWQDIKRWIKSYLDKVFSILFPSRSFSSSVMGSLKLRHLMRQFTISALNGDLNLDPEVVSMLMKNTYDYQLRSFTEKNSIIDAKDLSGYFLNGSDALNDGGIVDPDQMTEALSWNLDDRVKDGLVTFSVFNKKVEVKYTPDKKVMKSRIRKEVVNPMFEQDSQMNDLVRDILLSVSTGASIEDAMDIFDPDRKYDPKTVVEDILYFAGGRNEIDQILTYDQLKNSKNPHIKALYKEGFEGFNPLVVIHSINDYTGEVSISLIDNTIFNLGAKAVATNNNLLTSSFQAGASFKRSGGTMTNRLGDFRRFILGLQMVAMGDGNKLSVRNLGVLKIERNGVDHWMTPNLNDLLRNIKAVGQNKVLLDAIDNADIKKVLTNNHLLNKEYSQSYRQRILSYYDKPSNRIKLGGKASLFGETVTDAQLSELVAWRLNVLETYKYLSAEQMAEKELLAATLYQTTSGDTGTIDNIDGMSDLAKKFIASHNVKNPVIQYVKDQLIRSIDKVVNKVRSYQKELDPYLNDVIKHYHKKHGLAYVERFLRDIGSKYFENLYKTTSVYDQNGYLLKDKDGNAIIRKIPEIHWDVNNSETAKLLSSGQLSMVEINFANKFLDLLEQRWIDNLYHQAKKYNEEVRREDIAKRFYSEYRRGVIPAIGKTASALISQLNIKAATKASVDRWGRAENIFVGDLAKRNELDELSTHFSGQLEESERLKAAGLINFGVDLENNPKYMVFDDERNKTMSLNLQDIGNYFMMEGIRKEVYESDFLPHYNAARTIIKSHDILRKRNLGQKDATTNNDLEYLTEWVDRLVYQRTADNKDDSFKFNIGGYTLSAPELVRSATQLMTFSSLALKPTIWLKSFLYNTINTTMIALSNSIVNQINKSVGVDEGSLLFGVKDIAYAHSQITPGKGFKKAWELAKTLKVIEGTERDLLSSPIINKTNQNVLQDRYAHIGNWATDAYAKTLSMVAMMHKEGSYDAYYLDKNGEIRYDVTKDRRFYKDGVKLTKNGEDAIMEHIRQNLIKEGNMIDGDMVLGHDALLSDNFRWVSDKFVIGSMTPTSKWLLSNHYLGSLFANFRGFSVDKLNNAGVFAEGWLTKSGGQYKAVKDGDTVITKRDAVMIEGMWKSVINGYIDLWHNRNQPAVWWKNMSPIRKMNMAKSIVQIAFFCVLKALIGGFRRREDELRFSTLYQDLMVAFVIGDFFKSPMAIVNTTIRLFDTAFDDSPNKFKKLFRFVPGYEFFNLPEAIKNYSDKEAKEEYRERKALKEEAEREKRKAADGLVLGNPGMGSWNLIEDLSGMPKHSEGGVDLSVNNGNVYFGEVHAKRGLVIKAQDGLVKKPSRKEIINKYNSWTKNDVVQLKHIRDMEKGGDTTKRIPIGEDREYDIAGFVRNSYVTESALNEAKKYSEKWNTDPYVLLGALGIEMNGEVESYKKNNYRDTSTKLIESYKMPPVKDEYQEKDFLSLVKGSPTPDRALQLKYNRWEGKMKEIEKELLGIESPIEEVAYFISKFGLDQVNPKQMEYEGAKYPYEVMVNTAADYYRQLNLF